MSSKSTVFYNRFSFLYPVVDVFLSPQKRLLTREINKLPHGKLLDVGVGNGSHLKYYKRHNITGIDTSLEMLNKARSSNNNRVELIEMNGEDLSFSSGSFDYVVLSHVIAVVDDPEQLLLEVYRVLRPGGHVFILNHFTPNNWIRHIDQGFDYCARLLHFRSIFHQKDLKALLKLELKSEISTSISGYFKLLIFLKK
jgi:phosphatidylethanolamine/phosphatidyl-N-methylethanolamine N-methyltransferase